jgi:Na+/H+-dicarboxylate symporter
VRWKLLIITSLVAALLNAGGCLALVYWLRGSANPSGAQPLLLVAVIIAPLVIYTLAGIFVYRHTARRRKLQAAATVLLSIILTLAALVVAQIFLNRPADGRRELPPTPHTVS